MPNPDFDPIPSIIKSLQILNAARVSSFALVGQFAVRHHLGKSPLEGLNDVDIGVPLGSIWAIEKAMKDEDLSYDVMKIGGFRIRHDDLKIDFIDRRFQELNGLYEEAIKKSHTSLYVEDLVVFVVDVEYLIAIKMASGEVSEDEDVIRLLTVPGLDFHKNDGDHRTLFRALCRK